MKPVEIYLGKYPQQIDDNRTDEEKIIAYFTSLFGDKLNLIKVVSSNKILKEYCEGNGYSKEFVLETLKKYFKSKIEPHSALREVRMYDNETLKSLLKEIKEISKQNAPFYAKKNDLMKDLFTYEKTKYNTWLDQFHNVQQAIEIEILERIRTDNW